MPVTKKSYGISIRINTLLYSTLSSYLSIMHRFSDYTYSSTSDILREILLRLEDGELSHTEVDCINEFNPQDYAELTLRINKKQKEFWTSLPDRNKRRILEKAIKIYIENIPTKYKSAI